MHLTVENCWNGDHLSDNCVIQWMFRTRTIFYQYPDFDLPAYFGVACWNYVVAGIVMMVTAPPAWFVRLWPQPPERRARFTFPYYTFIVLLIFVQSPLSFLADYIYMDQDSIFHVIDRMVAVPLMTLELWKVSCLWRWQAYVDITTSTSIATRTVPKSTSYYDDYHKITVVVLYSFGTIMAVGCFLLSQQSQSLRNINGFILWHNRWHLYPLYASVITLYDHCIQQFHHQHSQPRKQEDKDAASYETRHFFPPFLMMKLSTVSSSSSLSSTITAKEKDA